jgi:hypothetical protein
LQLSNLLHLSLEYTASLTIGQAAFGNGQCFNSLLLKNVKTFPALSNI